MLERVTGGDVVRQEKIKKAQWNVILLGIASLFNDIGSEMIMPILPMFIRALGGGSVIIGLVGGLRDSVASIFTVLCGYWSDAIRKRMPFVFAGYLVSFFFKLLLSFAQIWPLVVVFSSLERLGKGMRTAPRDAIIAGSMPEKRGERFGIHRTLDTTGALLGSIFVLLLFWFYGLSFNVMILIAACITVFSLIPLFFVTENSKKTISKRSFSIGLANLDRSLFLFIVIAGVFALANFSYMFFILRAQEFFTGKFAIGIPILLYIFFNSFYVACAVPAGKLSDRIGRSSVIIAGYLLFSLVTLGFALFKTIPMLVLLFIMYGIAQALIEGNQRAHVSDLSPPSLRATALGTFHTIKGIAALIASLIAGVLYTQAPAFTFVYGSIVSACAALLLGIFSLRD